MITAIVLFLLASLIALNVARRHEIGRKYVTPPNPWADATAPATATQAPARRVATHCDRARPRWGTASTGTWRSDEDDQYSWHAGRSRRSRPCVPRNSGARSPGKPGPSGRDGPHRLPEGRPRGTSATEPVGRIRRRNRTCRRREHGSSRTSGRREATRGQALVRSSRWPPGGHPRRVNTAHCHRFHASPDAHEQEASRWTPSRSPVSTAGSSRSGIPESPPAWRPVGTCSTPIRCGGSRSLDSGARRTRDQGGLVIGPTRHESTRAPRLVPCCSAKELVPDRTACGETP
jgi:hypothetical protein